VKLEFAWDQPGDHLADVHRPLEIVRSLALRAVPDLWTEVDGEQRDEQPGDEREQHRHQPQQRTTLPAAALRRRRVVRGRRRFERLLLVRLLWLFGHRSLRRR
jgi:hypothetical protein